MQAAVLCLVALLPGLICTDTYTGRHTGPVQHDKGAYYRHYRNHHHNNNNNKNSNKHNSSTISSYSRHERLLGPPPRAAMDYVDFDGIVLDEMGNGLPDRRPVRLDDAKSGVIVKPKKKRKKTTIIVIHENTHLTDGTELKGKFKSLKACMKLIEVVPSCLAGDFDSKSQKCYCHDYVSVCPASQQIVNIGYDTMARSAKGVTNFKKIPCTPPAGIIPTMGDGGLAFNWLRPGRQVLSGRGTEMFKINDIKTCMKKCLEAGQGLNGDAQICFGINYDFENHKCYFLPIDVCDGGPSITTLQLLGQRRIAPALVLMVFCPTV